MSYSPPHSPFAHDEIYRCRLSPLFSFFVDLPKNAVLVSPPPPPKPISTVPVNGTSKSDLFFFSSDKLGYLAGAPPTPQPVVDSRNPLFLTFHPPLGLNSENLVNSLILPPLLSLYIPAYSMKRNSHL